jgi:hypothetical protein
MWVISVHPLEPASTRSRPSIEIINTNFTGKYARQLAGQFRFLVFAIQVWGKAEGYYRLGGVAYRGNENREELL